MTISDLLCFGGDKGNRTPDLMNANHALSQVTRLRTPQKISENQSAHSISQAYSFILIISNKRRQCNEKSKVSHYLTPDERRTVINSLIDLRNDLLSQGRYTDIIDELLIKLTKSKVKKIKVKEV